MKIIHSILVPIDFSACAENAYQFSLHLADKWKSTVKLLHIVSPDYGVTDLPVLVDIATKEKIEVALQVLKDFKANGLAKVVEMMPSLPTVTHDLKVSSLPYAAINTEAAAEAVDMVVMGTNDYHSAWENAFGTNATSVLKQAHCHVLVVPEVAEFRGFSTVGFAANLHETDPYHLWKFCKLMEPFHAIIHCVHIEKAGSAENTKIRFEELQEFFAHNDVALQLQFHALEEETIETGLEAFVNTWNLDLVAMSSPHRDIFSQVFHKSMTKQMALHSKVPLLVMK